MLPFKTSKDFRNEKNRRNGVLEVFWLDTQEELFVATARSSGKTAVDDQVKVRFMYTRPEWAIYTVQV